MFYSVLRENVLCFILCDILCISLILNIGFLFISVGIHKVSRICAVFYLNTKVLREVFYSDKVESPPLKGRGKTNQVFMQIGILKLIVISIKLVQFCVRMK